MPLPTSSLVSRILAAIPPGSAKQDGFGLTVVPLEVRGGLSRPPPRLVFRELEPAHPDSLVATNRTTRGGIARFGQRVCGGMTDRAVTASTAVLPGTTEVVPVEPLSPSWWRERESTTADALPPALTALLVLAASDRPGLRSVARTALWETYRQLSRRRLPDGRGGWLLMQGERLLAAHLVGPDGEPPPKGGALVGAHPLSLVRDALADGAGGGVIQIVSRDADVAEVWLVSASPHLAEAVLAVAMC